MMEKNYKKILKISAKFSFRELRNRAPFFCGILNSEVFITRKYWEHISFSREKRDEKEINERLLVINLIQEILKKGEIYEKREKFIRIELEIDGVKFACILLKKQTLILMSAFIVRRK